MHLNSFNVTFQKTKSIAWMPPKGVLLSQKSRTQ
ncbi:unnamed protein product [Tetraodon nigroviridis]|uniref:(spotted green pufferfish) hypothetical protein n=1 Tax=Tetraodon nigroviridis TaxID=99883 RepID=Q4RKY6_TETNG|nr:unnamed protein product [Tetraodon nigroviridis]